MTTLGPFFLVNQLVTFASNDETIVRVDEYGVITGRKAGTATVMAVASDTVLAECTITVRTRIPLILPSFLQVIEEEAFCSTKAEEIVLSNRVTAIGSLSFADSNGLIAVYMPDNVETIAEDAFVSSKKVNFICESENTAADFAKVHHIPWVVQ